MCERPPPPHSFLTRCHHPLSVPPLPLPTRSLAARLVCASVAPRLYFCLPVACPPACASPPHSLTPILPHASDLRCARMGCRETRRIPRWMRARPWRASGQVRARNGRGPAQIDRGRRRTPTTVALRQPGAAAPTAGRARAMGLHWSALCEAPPAPPAANPFLPPAAAVAAAQEVGGEGAAARGGGVMRRPALAGAMTGLGGRLGAVRQLLGKGGGAERLAELARAHAGARAASGGGLQAAAAARAI